MYTLLVHAHFKLKQLVINQIWWLFIFNTFLGLKSSDSILKCEDMQVILIFCGGKFKIFEDITQMQGWRGGKHMILTSIVTYWQLAGCMLIGSGIEIRF